VIQQHLRTAGVVLMSVAAFSIARAYAGEEYLQRTDTITMSAGNAKEVNSAIHTIDPWPPRVYNRRIPANGARMTGAIQRYQQPQVNAPSGLIPGALTPVPAYTPGAAIGPSGNPTAGAPGQ
jgi:hypothetical protein